jgi:enamine deaminase RidA (YjgF/YER057c/UK114 family)
MQINATPVPGWNS